MPRSMKDGGQGHQRIESTQKFIDRVYRWICGDDFREIIAKGDGHRTVEVGTDVRGFVGDFESVDTGVFDNMIVLAVVDDLHGAIRKVSRAPARMPLHMVRYQRFSRWQTKNSFVAGAIT
jgi:hypothetical protein